MSRKKSKISRVQGREELDAHSPFELLLLRHLAKELDDLLAKSLRSRASTCDKRLELGFIRDGRDPAVESLNPGDNLDGVENSDSDEVVAKRVT